MSISGVSTPTATTGQGTASAATAKAVTQNDFLQLLVAQIKTQDPLNPMDGTQFTAQLAQFSSLEQLYNVNTNLTALQNAQAAITNTQALGYIGKTVIAAGNTVTLGADGGADLNFTLGGNAAAVGARIYNADGVLVRSLSAGPMNAGSETLAWNGRDDNGNRLAPGSYRFDILAMNATGAMVSASTYNTGTVTGLTMTNGNAGLLVGDTQVNLNQVVKVMEPAPKAAATPGSDTEQEG